MKQGEAEVAAKKTIWVGISGQCKGQKLSPPLGKCGVSTQVCDPTESFIPVSHGGAAAQPMHNQSLCWQHRNLMLYNVLTHVCMWVFL